MDNNVNLIEQEKGLPPLVAIVGPTAIGKTALSLGIAEARPEWNCEIVSADSRQIYRYMDTGTGKATLGERACVPHHLIGIVNPDQSYTLAEYQEAAMGAIRRIHERGGLPLLVGGSGLYVQAVLEGLAIPAVPPNPELRAQLEAEAAAHGAEALHARLAALDPLAAANIDLRNVRRVIRALEVTLATGKPFSEQRQRRPVAYRILTLGLTAPRPILYERIDRRIDAMFVEGFVDEVRQLNAMGFGCDLPSMSGIGYAQICAYLNGDISLEQAIVDTKHATHRFARHQYAWFRPRDPNIHWIDITEGQTVEQALSLIDRFMAHES